jgi:hypothetical protein
LLEHSRTVKHIENVNLNKTIKNVENNLTELKLSHKDKVKRAEIKLAAFFAEHNISFCSIDHLIPILKDIYDDSKVMQDITLGRNKCRNIVKDILAKNVVEKIIYDLQPCRFSILIDKSTDISDTK